MSSAIPKTSRELQSAIDDDKRKQAINDAKFRAVAQHEDYDTFKNMVSVAHLKPLQAPKSKREPEAPAFAFDASGARDNVHEMELPSSRVLPTNATTSAAVRAPATEAEYHRQWAAHAEPGARARWLVEDVPPVALTKVFARELTADVILGIAEEMQGALARDGAAESHVWALAAFEALMGAGRFALALRKLDASAKATLKANFDALASAGHVDANDVEVVRKKFKV